MTKTSIVQSSEEQGSSASEKERDVPIAMVKEDGGDEEVNVRVQGRGNCNLDKQKQGRAAASFWRQNRVCAIKANEMGCTH